MSDTESILLRQAEMELEVSFRLQSLRFKHEEGQVVLPLDKLPELYEMVKGTKALVKACMKKD